MAKSPKAFDRLYVNMIKAGEAGGALEIILQRLAEFQERSEALQRKVKGALVYPIMRRHLRRRHPRLHHDQDRARLPEDLRRLRRRAAGHDRRSLIAVSDVVVNYWYLLPGIPIGDLAVASS